MKFVAKKHAFSSWACVQDHEWVKWNKLWVRVLMRASSAVQNHTCSKISAGWGRITPCTSFILVWQTLVAGADRLCQVQASVKMAKYTLKTQQGNGKPSGQIMCIADSSRSTQNTTNNKDKQMQIASNADDLRTFRAKTAPQHIHSARAGRVVCIADSSRSAQNAPAKQQRRANADHKQCKWVKNI